MGTYVVIGLVNGVIYGLAALGLVLIYKGSRVFNFAQGEFGTLAMYMLFLFHEKLHINYLVAIVAGLLAATAFGLVTERFVARPLANAPKVIALVGTAGAALLAIGLEFVIAEPKPRSVAPAFQAGASGGLHLFGFVVSPQNILSLICLILVAAGAALFFQRTYLGTAILANSQDSTAARIVGANADRISAVTWGIAGFLGGLAGILLAPDATIVPGYMTTGILIPAFTAGILGGMTSLVGAFVAGQIVGLVEAIGLYEISKYDALKVVPEGTVVLVFAVLVLTLAIRPKGLFGSEA